MPCRVGAVQVRRADRGVRPYDGLQGVRYMRAVGDAGPYGGVIGGAAGRDDVGIVPYGRIQEVR